MLPILYFSGNLISLTKNLGMILLLVAFLLIEMQNSKEKVIVAFERSGKSKGQIVGITKKIISDIVHFLSIKFFISLATGLLVALAAMIVKLDFAIMWGFIAFIMKTT